MIRDSRVAYRQRATPPLPSHYSSAKILEGCGDLNNWNTGCDVQIRFDVGKLASVCHHRSVLAGRGIESYGRKIIFLPSGTRGFLSGAGKCVGRRAKEKRG